MANWTKLGEKEGLVRQKKREEEGTVKDETERSVSGGQLKVNVLLSRD